MSGSKHKQFNFNFLRYRYVAGLVSFILMAASVYTWVSMGSAKYGVDFVGGAEVVVAFEKSLSSADIRELLDKENIRTATVQEFVEDGKTEFAIRLRAEESGDVRDKVKVALSKIQNNSYTVLSEDFVGPVIGEQIRKDGLIAAVLALIVILGYVSFRFEWRFAVGAVAALIHDVVITAGAFLWYGGQINSGVLASLLTIIGYSLNDTIIIFDRVRENVNSLLKKSGSKTLPSFPKIINDSINQTLTRSILTSLTTLLVVTCLWLFGGGEIVDLAFTLMVGVVVGSYSTTFIASPVVLLFSKKKKQ